MYRRLIAAKTILINVQLTSDGLVIEFRKTQSQYQLISVRFAISQQDQTDL
jgi:hypothetical protein